MRSFDAFLNVSGVSVNEWHYVVANLFLSVLFHFPLLFVFSVSFDCLPFLSDRALISIADQFSFFINALNIFLLYLKHIPSSFCLFKAPIFVSLILVLLLSLASMRCINRRYQYPRSFSTTLRSISIPYVRSLTPFPGQGF